MGHDPLPAVPEIHLWTFSYQGRQRSNVVKLVIQEKCTCEELEQWAANTNKHIPVFIHAVLYSCWETRDIF